MNKIADFMGKDHDRLDAIFKEFQNSKTRDSAKVRDLFSEFKKGLQRHIVWEEEILFPRIDDAVGEEKEKSLFGKMRDLPEEKYLSCCGKQ